MKRRVEGMRDCLPRCVCLQHLYLTGKAVVVTLCSMYVMHIVVIIQYILGLINYLHYTWFFSHEYDGEFIISHFWMSIVLLNPLNNTPMYKFVAFRQFVLVGGCTSSGHQPKNNGKLLQTQRVYKKSYFFNVCPKCICFGKLIKNSP